MKLDGKPVGICEKSKLFPRKLINADWFRYNPFLFQFRHYFLNIIRKKRQMTKARRFRPSHTRRRIFHPENLQFCGLVYFQIQLPVVPFLSEIFPNDLKSQFIHIKIL